MRVRRRPYAGTGGRHARVSTNNYVQNHAVLRPETRYARRGDLQVAFQVTGRGPVDLVFVPGVVSHVDQWWQLPYSSRFAERLESICRLIRFDACGTGLSDRPATSLSLEERADDIRAVLDAAGSRRAVVFARAGGCAIACSFAAQNPERAAALILFGPMARQVSGPDYPWGVSPERYAQRVQELNESWPPDWYIGSTDFEGDADALRRYFRAAASPGAAAALYTWHGQVDLRPVLPTIRTPTLVLSVGGDARVTAAVKHVAGQIPSARFHELAGADLGSSLEDVLRLGLKFVQEHVPASVAAAPATRVLVTILGLDVIGSTAHVARIGDTAWRELLDRFYRLVQEELAAHAGVEIDRAGDGLLATFDAPGRAILCARAIQQESRGLGIRLRAGVHTGEVERSGGAVRGLAVHLAARVMALAGGDEILVTSTVRELVAGSQFRFEDRGVHELKGVPDPCRVFLASP